MSMTMSKGAASHQSATYGDVLRVVAVLALAAAVGVGVYFMIVIRGGSTPSNSAAAKQGAIAVSDEGLATLASLGRPIYWAGEKPGDTYELTQSAASSGRVYVRYLPSGVKVGSAGVYLTVATYPIADAFTVTRRVAHKTGSVIVPVKGGGVAFYKTDLPTNVYLAYPGTGYQVEVFDPVAADAHSIVADGGISRVVAKSPEETVPKTAAVAATSAKLAKVESRLGRPLYWAGAQAGATYELTQTPDGRVYVRYLPPGVKVGADQPYLTVGTYPVTDAYKTTRQAAKRKGSVEIKIAGGIAFYNKTRPTSVYVAFPGVDEQIEVFDPSANLVHKTVAASEIRSIAHA
jgi:hypothetical protein